jgi:hypothetical protein
MPEILKLRRFLTGYCIITYVKDNNSTDILRNKK